MDETSEAVAAAFEATVLLDYFADLPDPRQPGKVAYHLDEVLLLALLAILAGAEGFTDIARFGHKKIDLLRRFLPFQHGTPSHDHLGDIFPALDPVAFRRCFAAWAATLTQTPLDVIAIDGKTSRRSGRAGARDALHVASAFARQRLVLAQTKVSGKSNEIAAIPALLDLLSIEGAIVTIDAMGCQRAIARKILDKKADHVLALKGNQGTLQEDVTLFIEEQRARDFADCTISTHETVEGDHGRIETRRVTVIHQVAWLQKRHAWQGLRSLLVVGSTRELAIRTERETRCYLTSSPFVADCIGPATRQHRAIENSLHWILDVTFHEDQSRIRTAHAPENILAVRHIAVNVAAPNKGKDSMRSHSNRPDGTTTTSSGSSLHDPSPDSPGKIYLFVAIDQTSKSAFVELHEQASRRIAGDFLKALATAVPYKIQIALTDNGAHFNDPNGDGWTPEDIKATRAEKVPFRCHAFEGSCADLDIEHRLTKPRHPWTNGQVERMNRTIKEATVKRFHYDSCDQLRQHLAGFVAAYNFARRLKTLRGLTPYEAICKVGTDDPSRFTNDPHHQTPGLHILESV